MDKKRLFTILIFIIFFIILIVISSLYYNNKYSVRFETGTDDVILNSYVSKNGKVEEPIQPSKEGYVFVEWQLDGETFSFDTEIDEDIVLTAKWVKEEYITIIFDTQTEEIIESKKILKGDSIDELPIVNKENYEFIGWYLKGELYNNEEIYSDITLVAQYKNDIIDPTFKIGDKVIIIGNYSNSAYSINAYNKKAIGWKREILDIIEDSEYPYMVGNSYGVTGFFKADSIEGGK